MHQAIFCPAAAGKQKQTTASTSTECMIGLFNLYIIVSVCSCLLSASDGGFLTFDEENRSLISTSIARKALQLCRLEVNARWSCFCLRGKVTSPRMNIKNLIDILCNENVTLVLTSCQRYSSGKRLAFATACSKENNENCDAVTHYLLNSSSCRFTPIAQKYVR